MQLPVKRKRRASSENRSPGQSLARWGTTGALGFLALVLLVLAFGPWLSQESQNVGELPSSSSSTGAIMRAANQLTGLPGWDALDKGQGQEPTESETGQQSESDDSRAATSSPRTSKSSSTTTLSTIDPRSEVDPQKVVIPSIDVDATLVPVGLNQDGTMEVPDFGLAAWYDLGPRPGAPGPAVLVAHVDSRKGPDVFYRLKELEIDDEVQVLYPDGLRVTFKVEAKEQIAKSELPVDRIWLQTEEPLLRLITCGGEFDRSTGHYRSNVIVYASLAASD